MPARAACPTRNQQASVGSCSTTISQEVSQFEHRRVRCIAHCLKLSSISILSACQRLFGFWLTSVLRCAVVASGANLLEGELGQEIDEHDVVIRMNLVSFELFDLSESVILNRRLFFLDPQAPVLGFQKHVGRKTNFRWLIHPSCDSYIFLDWEAQDPQKTVPTVVMCSNLSKKQFKKYTQNYADANYEVLRRVQRRRLEDNMSSVPIEDVVGNLELFNGSSIPFYSILTGAEYGLKLPEHPSTGIWAILHACSVCEFVTAYGFTIADKTINGTTTLKLWHYYSHPDDASMLPVKNQPHKFHQEREVLQRLQNLSLIKMRSPRSR